MLQDFKSNKSFPKLHTKCTQLPYSPLHHVEWNTIPIDENAKRLMPDDIPQLSDNQYLVPVKVDADGNCLPHSGSFLATGNNQYHHDELRVRIITELVMHKDLYLSGDYLRKGIHVTDRTASKLPCIYAMMSEKFIPNKPLDNANIARLYEEEILSITAPGTYMGIWQLFGLSSVLQTSLVCIYPKFGNPNIRRDLHRQILPRTGTEGNCKYVMWTSTRSDLTPTHWVPNHFVPVVAMMEPKNIESDIGLGMIEELPELHDVSQLMSRHVVVMYQDVPYPGIVKDIDEQELLVSCMHKLGVNRYFWPRLLEDVCWYSYDKLLAIIPEPQHVTARHYQIDKTIWQKIAKKM